MLESIEKKMDEESDSDENDRLNSSGIYMKIKIDGNVEKIMKKVCFQEDEDSVSSRTNTDENVSTENAMSVKSVSNDVVFNENSFFQESLIEEFIDDTSETNVKMNDHPNKLKRFSLLPEKEFNENLSLDIVLAIRTCILGFYSRKNQLENNENLLSVDDPSDHLLMERHYKLSRIGNDNSFTVKDFYPKIFSALRNNWGVDSESYLHSWSNSQSHLIQFGGGKSGAFFLYSHDRRYILKSVSKSDSKQLRRIIWHYFMYVQRNRSSLLSKPYGHHKITWKKRGSLIKKTIYVVIFSNVFYHVPNESLLEIYDLKGSRVGRENLLETSYDPSHPIANKDLDFLKRKRRLFVAKSTKKKLFKQIKSDSDWLASQQLMDYSILIGCLPKSIADNEIPMANHGSSRNLIPSTIFSRETQMTDRISDRSLRTVPFHVFFCEEAKEIRHDSLSSSTLRRPSKLISDLFDRIYPKYSQDRNRRSTIDSPVSAKKEIQIHEEKDSMIHNQSFLSIEHMNGISWSEYGIMSADRDPNRKEIYYLGIIDYLQNYDKKKKIAHFAKSFKHVETDLSTVNPSLYASRFQKFLKKILVYSSKSRVNHITRKQETLSISEESSPVSDYLGDSDVVPMSSTE